MRTLQKKDNKKKESSWEGEEDEVEATGDRGRTEAEVRRLQRKHRGGCFHCWKQWKWREVMELMNLAVTHRWKRRPLKSPRENETYAISLCYANTSKYSGWWGGTKTGEGWTSRLLRRRARDTRGYAVPLPSHTMLMSWCLLCMLHCFTG